jgi:hypothetical protein
VSSVLRKAFLALVVAALVVLIFLFMTAPTVDPAV